MSVCQLKITQKLYKLKIIYKNRTTHATFFPSDNISYILSLTKNSVSNKIINHKKIENTNFH